MSDDSSELEAARAGIDALGLSSPVADALLDIWTELRDQHREDAELLAARAEHARFMAAGWRRLASVEYGVGCSMELEHDREQRMRVRAWADVDELRAERDALRERVGEFESDAVWYHGQIDALRERVRVLEASGTRWHLAWLAGDDQTAALLAMVRALETDTR